MRLKNAVLGFNEKGGKFKSVAPKRKTHTDSTVTEPKFVRIPIFLYIPRAHEQGQICIYGFMGKICIGKKTEINRFRVPIHFSFFLSWVSKTQPNHWTKRMANTRLAT